MTVKHVAWLRFKDSVTGERIDRHMGACRGLVDRIPAVQNLECGASFTDRAGGFTHCLIVTLANRDVLGGYLEHPDHVPVAEALKKDLADLRVMDVEI